MPNYVPQLKSFMRELAIQLGGSDTNPTYEALGAKLGVSRTTIGNLMAGIPSRREKIRDMADRARVPRARFLEAAGYHTTDEDIRWDHEHYPDQAGKEDKPLANEGEIVQGVRIASVQELESHPLIHALELPRLEQSLPMSPPRWRDGELVSGIEPTLIPGIYHAIAEGDSMEPDYCHGDYVLIRPIYEGVKIGGSYIVWMNEGLTCKILESATKINGRTRLRFAGRNGRYPAIEVWADEVSFQGVPIGRVRREDVSMAMNAWAQFPEEGE